MHVSGILLSPLLEHSQNLRHERGWQGWTQTSGRAPGGPVRGGTRVRVCVSFHAGYKPVGLEWAAPAPLGGGFLRNIAGINRGYRWGFHLAAAAIPNRAAA
ncbi:hypothetical protein GCM10009765_03280 [Fodinicola feengrottensis]|uniref:Uncharacterized protein n=1 Tax=Fodinicola feengrottensis TaxID=435914 RepID=A0ABN2FR36_9ACTN